MTKKKNKGSECGIFPDPGDPKRPDPDPQHSFKCLIKSCPRDG